MYKIQFTGSAEKYLKKIKEKPLKAASETALNNISKDPYLGELKTGDLTGIYCYDFYYNKTDYEIAYKIYENDDQLIIIILAGTRQNFYKQLKNYMN